MTTDLGIDLPQPPANGNADPNPKTTAGSMVEMLRRYYIPDDTRPAWLFAAEIEAPGPSGRRADLITLGVTAATSCKLIGHEIKVNRADVLNELADLTKCDPWMQYCDFWWLVVPHLSLVEGLAIPETWGIMLPPSGRRTRSVTIHRQAPKLEPVNQAPALRSLTARVHWRLRDEKFHHLRSRNEVETLRSRIEVLERDPGRRSRNADPTGEFIAQVIKKLGGTWDGETIRGYNTGALTVDDVVTALADLKQIRALAERAETAYQHAKANLQTARDIIARTLTDLEPKKGSRRESVPTPGRTGT